MTKVTNKELRSVFWRSFALQGAFNYERMQNIGYCYSMIPVIRRLYGEKKDQSLALIRHLEIFNTTPAVVPTIMGITAAMEKVSITWLTIGIIVFGILMHAIGIL